MWYCVNHALFYVLGLLTEVQCKSKRLRKNCKQNSSLFCNVKVEDDANDSRQVSSTTKSAKVSTSFILQIKVEKHGTLHALDWAQITTLFATSLRRSRWTLETHFSLWLCCTDNNLSFDLAGSNTTGTDSWRLQDDWSYSYCISKIRLPSRWTQIISKY